MPIKRKPRYGTAKRERTPVCRILSKFYRQKCPISHQSRKREAHASQNSRNLCDTKFQNTLQMKFVWLKFQTCFIVNISEMLALFLSFLFLNGPSPISNSFVAIPLAPKFWGERILQTFRVGGRWP